MSQTSTLFTLLLCALFALSSCKTLPADSATKSISYTIANRYFVKNNVEVLPQGAVTTAEDFRKYFGEAAAMGGKDALPTPIDFKKQFAIVVCVPETNRDTDIKPVALKKAGESLVFSYKIEQGQERSYTTLPMLLIFVDKKYEGKVVLQQQ